MNGSAAAASPALLDKKAAKLKYKEERRRIKEKEKEMKEQKKKEAKEAKKRGKGFVGASISGPTNFSHDTHVGWDMDHGFEVRNIPAEWKRLFMEAGVKKSELQDPETRKAILNAVRQSVYGAPPAPPSGVLGVAGPPPPPAPPAPPAAPAPPPAAPVLSPRAPAAPPGGLVPPPLPPRVDIEPGFKGQALWSEDGNWYQAVVDSISDQDGVKYYAVTFTEYGNQETVTESGLRNADGSPIDGGGSSSAPGAPAPPAGGVDLAALLQAKANALKTPDLTNMSEQQEGNIVDAIQNALSSRRQGMCYSVYGQDAGQDGWDDDDDESWMDF